MVRKPYPPGPKTKKRMKSLSEYGKELREKQKLRRWYNLKEGQFSKYVKTILKTKKKTEDSSLSSVEVLESRLDNVIFRLGFAPSRNAARKMVSHGHILVNGKPVNIPSFLVKKGDKIAAKLTSAKKGNFKNLPNILKKHKPPVWLELNPEKLEAKVIGEPSFEEAAPPAEILSIFEFYSK
jgi:small subunit ribosomal protein S4